MAGKFVNKKKKKKNPTIYVLLVIMVAAVVLVGAMLLMLEKEKNGAGQEEVSTVGSSGPLVTDAAQSVTEQTVADEIQEKKPITLLEQKGLLISDINRYTGAYMEDGSDEMVSGVMSIQLVNNSDQALQYAEITLSYSDGDANFQVTNLPAGATAVILEKSRRVYTDEEPTDLVISNTAFLPEFEMCEDVLRITGNDGVLNVKNISEKDINGVIAIYYKNKIQDIYYGGITYRAKIEGGLDANEIRQITTRHYHPDNCEILMATYAE